MKRLFILALLSVTVSSLQSCTDNTLSTAESLIDAFYSFDPDQLEPLLAHAQSSKPSLMYYQGWAEGGNYKIVNRQACVSIESDLVSCSIRVEDDPILALGIDFKVTDTFHIKFDNGTIVEVETSSDDPDIYYAAADWVRENIPERVAEACQGHFDGGPTPGDCARVMAEGYAQFRASNDYPDQ